MFQLSRTEIAANLKNWISITGELRVFSSKRRWRTCLSKFRRRDRLEAELSNLLAVNISCIIS